MVERHDTPVISVVLFLLNLIYLHVMKLLSNIDTTQQSRLQDTFLRNKREHSGACQ